MAKGAKRKVLDGIQCFDNNCFRISAERCLLIEWENKRNGKFIMGEKWVDENKIKLPTNDLEV